MTNLGFITERVVGGTVYTLLHHESGNTRDGFVNRYYLMTNQDVSTLKEITMDDWKALV